MQFEFIKREELKPKPDFSSLKFGKTFTDYMFIMEYEEGIGWHSAYIRPYGPIEMSPSSCILHYAQGLFEGMKAYKNDNGDVYLFRPLENFKRLNDGCDRLCIPQIDSDFVLTALKELLRIESDWIPDVDGASLYIRPFILADEEALGVHPSHKYKFMIILSPVGSYYTGGLSPVDILVEENYVRAAVGGTGAVKAIGNYAASLKGQQRAEQQNYSQVLWLDGVHRRFVEEVGAMNIFFVINGELCTPALSGSILPGITRNSVIKLARHLGYKVNESTIDINDVIAAVKDGTLTEAFGSGTAAAISPVGSLCYMGDKATIGDGNIGAITQKLYDTLTGIQYGRLEDPFEWRDVVAQNETAAK